MAVKRYQLGKLVAALRSIIKLYDDADFPDDSGAIIEPLEIAQKVLTVCELNETSKDEIYVLASDYDRIDRENTALRILVIDDRGPYTEEELQSLITHVIDRISEDA